MQHSSPVYQYMVNERGEIDIIIPFEGEQQAMKFTVSHPKFKPGSIVEFEENEMDELVGQFLSYTQTGNPPTFGVDKSRL